MTEIELLIKINMNLNCIGIVLSVILFRLFFIGNTK